MKLERQMLSLTFASAAILGCQPQPQTDAPDMYFTGKLQIKPTGSRPALDAYNAIIKPNRDQHAEGNPVEISTIRICDKEKWIDIPAKETDLPELAKQTDLHKETRKGKQGVKPCEIILPSGKVLEILVFEKK